MTKNNLCIVILVGSILFLLYVMNQKTTEGYEEPKTGLLGDLANVGNSRPIKSKIVDNIATRLSTDTKLNNNLAPIKSNKSENIKSVAFDIFKENNPASENRAGVPLPVVHESSATRVLGNSFDETNITNELGALIKSGKILTSEQLLPDDTELNEHNQFKVPTTYMDSNLAANGVDKFGVDTLGNSNKNGNQDLRGAVPVPKINVSSRL